MAKNFGQYDDDNPVMAILGKARLEEEKSKSEKIPAENETESKNFSKGEKNLNPKIQEASNIEKKAVEVQIQPQNQNSESDENAAADSENDGKEIRKILVNISIRETTKKEWKMFFLKHDLTMTQGIETAVEYLRAEVEKGSIRLSKGGVTRQE